MQQLLIKLSFHQAKLQTNQTQVLFSVQNKIEKKIARKMNAREAARAPTHRACVYTRLRAFDSLHQQRLGSIHARPQQQTAQQLRGSACLIDSDQVSLAKNPSQARRFGSCWSLVSVDDRSVGLVQSMFTSQVLDWPRKNFNDPDLNRV